VKGRQKKGRKKGRAKGATTGAPTGRPLTEITEAQWKVIASMAQDMCTNEEIADFLGIDKRTLYAPHIKEQFQRTTRMRRASTRWEVRKKQAASAKGGQVVPSIWWGKQFLGQADKHEHTGAEGGPLEVIAGVDDRLNHLIDKLQAGRK
jgi:hypothetical protein